MGKDFDGEGELLTANPATPGTAKSEWKSLFNFSSRQHLPILIVALVLSTAAGITGPALAYFFGKIFDAFSAYGSGAADGDTLMHKVSRDAIALCVLGGTAWLVKGGYFALWMVFGELQAKNARDLLFQNLLEKDFEWYEMRTSGIGALLPRLQTQIRELQIGTAQPLGFCIQFVVQAFASIGLAFYTSWNLTLVILAGLPISAVIMSLINSMMQPSIIAQEAELSLVSKIANSALSAIETVKCFNGQTFELEQYRPVVMGAAKYYMKQALSNSLQIGFVRFITTAMFVQGFWYGGHLVNTGKASAGDVLTTFWACLMATKAIEDILPHMIVLEKGRAAGAAMKIILEQMSRGVKVECRTDQSAPKFCEGDVEVRDVSFAYPLRPDNLVLNESTFFFPAGETTFVVGKSGSGKSTLGNLLMRFYEPTAGSVYIDGTSISELDINWLRNNITLVQQQSILFNETIFRNISFGRRNHLRVTKEQVGVCIDLASLQSTIQEMPKGLDTEVGSGGSALSGGQKQRIAVARARLRDTPILILDESTSALDYVSRKAVMEAIRDWRRGKTTIIITHDISQIREEDFVYALENGRIIEDGYRYALASLEKVASDSLASPNPGASGHFDFGFPGRPGHLQRNNRYSSIAFDTRRSIMRQDSIEMHLDKITGYASTPRSPSMGIAGPHVRPIAQKRSSAGNILDAIRGQPVVKATPRGSIYLATSNEVEMRNMHSATPKTLNLHRALSRSGRPMSMHQAMTMSSIYGDAMLPTNRRTLNAVPPLPHNRPMSTAAFVTLSDIQKPSESEVEETTRIQNVASIRSILRTVWPTLTVAKRGQLILGFASALVHAAGPPVFSYIFSQLLGTFFIKEGQARKSLIYSMAILGIAIIDAVSDGSMHYLLEGCGQAWIDSLRLQAFERVLDQPKAWFDEEENSLASLTGCLDRNAEEMRNLVGRFAPFIVVVAAMMTIATTWSLVVCWKLTLVGIAAAPSLYFVTKGFDAVSSKWENLTNDAGNEAGSIFVETFTDIRTVRALTLESYFHKKYNKATSKALIVGVKRAAYSGFFFGASDSAINFVTALVFWYGAKVVREGDFSAKSILTVFSMLLFSTANATAVMAFIPQISSSADTATRLLRLCNLSLHKSHEHTGTVKLNTADPTILSGPINFIDLTFTYPGRGPSAPALSKLNLTIPSGTSTALVGTSGSGKSTIVSLLLGLYPPNSASTSSPPTLTLSGHDIRTLHMPTLRSSIAIVSQTPTLFPTTVRSNITYGLALLSPLTTTLNIHSAARRAGIHDFILTLPRGYDTLIGEGGLGLSGGQAQRVVIARALVRRPRLLVLDEATSALDGDSAEVIRRSIISLVEESKYENRGRGGGGITVLIITHAKEMMACAENVVVLEKGRVVEAGAYEELLHRQGGKLRSMLSSGGVGEG